MNTPVLSVIACLLLRPHLVCTKVFPDQLHIARDGGKNICALYKCVLHSCWPCLSAGPHAPWLYIWLVNPGTHREESLAHV